MQPSGLLEALRTSATDCRACDLWSHATQTVFGEGPTPAPMMLVGEQPGDDEDRSGRPFVGPAGRVLDRALKEAGIERSDIYVTNAVKHFKWKARGKRRIHDKPNRTEVAACHPWLAGELEVAQPEVLVILGSTAGQALLGPAFRVGRERGCDLRDTGLAPHVVATIHPSAVLRVPDADREVARGQLTSDLMTASSLLG
jgi:uracil-DNA glycosylase